MISKKILQGTKNLFEFVFNPSILKKIDRYLLLNKPFLWSTRVHYVLYYGLSIDIILTFLTLRMVQSYQIEEFIQSIIWLLLIFEICAFFLWVFKSTLFNIEREYGQQKNFFRQSILEITTYLLCIFVVFSPSLVIKTYTTYTDYDVYSFVQSLFISTIGLVILVIRKYSNWRFVFLTILYVILMVIFDTIVWLVLMIFVTSNNLWGIDFDNGNVSFLLYCLIITATIFWIVIQSAIMVKEKKHSKLLLFGFGILPIYCVFLVMIFMTFLTTVNPEFDNPAYFALSLRVFLLCYFLLFPLQKKILIRNFSIPR